MTVICITGMHRSGTSLVARLLHLCGLYLGPEKELMPSSADNADGYWENLQFVELDNALLAQLNGTWDSPPSADSDLEMQRQPLPLVQKARALIHGFDDQPSWGWKDPRSALTLPFWLALIPDLKVINCVRNPLEIAVSLAKRDGFAKAFSFDLCYTYYQRLLAAGAANLLTTHYDAYFASPESELSRLLDFVGLPADSGTVSQACAAVRRPLKHNRATFEYLLAEGAPLKVTRLYAQMCMQSGPIYLQALKSGALRSASAGHASSDDLEYDLMERVLQNDQVVEALASHLAKKERDMQTLTAELNHSRRELEGIKKSWAWRVVQFLRRITGRSARDNT